MITMEDDPNEELPYVPFNDIDFSRMYLTLHSLPLFDDVYLNMQAINISMIDGFITDQEYILLREYFELEKTPTDQAMFVSAQSQMWIFALYELLRTWRQRIRKLKQWKEAGALEKMFAQVEADRLNLSASMRARHIQWVIDDPTAVEQLESARADMDGAYQLTSAIRINLAKHEVQGKPNAIVRAPGYGRINMWCGALDYELDLGDGTYNVVNRRDIAEALRKVPNRDRDDS